MHKQTCMCTRVSFEVKSVVEPFATKCTEVAFDVSVTLHVPVEKALEVEHFGADSAYKLCWIVF